VATTTVSSPLLSAVTALAETGADTSLVTTLAIIAAVLGGLGVLLVVLRVIARRRVR